MVPRTVRDTAPLTNPEAYHPALQILSISRRKPSSPHPHDKQTGQWATSSREPAHSCGRSPSANHLPPVSTEDASPSTRAPGRRPGLRRQLCVLHGAPVSAEGANQPGSGVRVPRTLPPVSAEGANQLFVPALKDASFPRVCLKARRRRDKLRASHSSAFFATFFGAPKKGGPRGSAGRTRARKPLRSRSKPRAATPAQQEDPRAAAPAQQEMPRAASPRASRQDFVQRAPARQEMPRAASPRVSRQGFVQRAPAPAAERPAQRQRRSHPRCGSPCAAGDRPAQRHCRLHNGRTDSTLPACIKPDS
jgi:hypothetical protein